MSKASNGAGSIYKITRPNGSTAYCVELSLGKKPNGARNRTRRTVATKKQAQDLLVRLRNEQLKGQLTTISAETVSTYGLRYVRDVSTLRVRPSTASDYEARLRRDITPYLGHVRVTDLKPAHIDKWMATLRQSGKSASTVNGARQVLNMVCKYAWRTDVIPSNPVAATDPVKKHAGDPTRVQAPWNRDEGERVLRAAIEQSEMDTFLHLMLHTGMRPGEALGLRWEDVDLTGRALHITGTLKEERRFLPDGQTVVRLVRNEPKTPSSRRSLPISEALLASLDRQQMRQAVARISQGNWHNSGYVLTSAVGTPISAPNLRLRFKKFLTSIDVRYIRPHDLRHTVAFLVLNDANVPIEKASQALGHTRIDTTKQIYAGHVPRYNDDFIAGIASVLPTTQAYPISFMSEQRADGAG